MTERRSDRQDGDGQNSGDRNGAYLHTDPQDGRVYWARDADAFIRRVGSQDEGCYGNSSLVTLREPPTFRGRHTRGIPLEE